MTAKRKRHRIVSSLLCLVIVSAFVISLPFARPARDKVAVNLNKQGCNFLWNYEIPGLTHNDKGQPRDWVWETIHYLESNLDQLGELESIHVPLSKQQHDSFYRWFDDYHKSLPHPYRVFVAEHEGRDYWFLEAEFEKQDAQVWVTLAEKLRAGAESFDGSLSLDLNQ